MTKQQKTPEQAFNESLASEESKLALAEMIEENKQDKIVETFVVKVPSDLFDNLDEL